MHPPGDPERTFGVILDTSGSMDRRLLAKALGAISSYSQSRDVHYARVVFCDAAPYDQGYLSPEDIAGRVQVKGRGGTVLQPTIDLLEQSEDFPKEGPLLIISDGWCDRLHIRRFGFHGASHRYIAGRMAELTGRSDLRLISCHLGGSSSLCAIRHGQSVATSMGMSPQSGLPQNNRVGDFDPYALPWIMRRRTRRRTRRAVQVNRRPASCVEVCPAQPMQ